MRLQGQETKVAYFVMSLPFSDAFFCQVFPRECTETFQEGHCRAFQFFGGVPTRISYDNSRIAVAKFVGRRGDTPTQEFLRLESHFLFGHHFCLVRRANEKGHVEGLVGFARRNFMVPIPQSTIWRSSTSSWLSPVESIWSGEPARPAHDQARTARSRAACTPAPAEAVVRGSARGVGQGQLALAGAVRYE